jgi:hypothetical protein
MLSKVRLVDVLGGSNGCDLVDWGKVAINMDVPEIVRCGVQCGQSIAQWRRQTNEATE